jgi:hypothetical protein
MDDDRPDQGDGVVNQMGSQTGLFRASSSGLTRGSDDPVCSVR